MKTKHKYSDLLISFANGDIIQWSDKAYGCPFYDFIEEDIGCPRLIDDRYNWRVKPEVEYPKTLVSDV